MNLEALYLQRPTPEYSQAFDLAAALPATAGPTLLVASSPSHAVEVLKRCATPLTVASTGTFAAEHFVAAAQAWAWNDIEATTLAQAGPKYARLVWAEPEATSAHLVAAQLRRLASPTTALYVITSSFLRRYLPTWQTPPYPARRPLTPGATAHLLRATCWRIAANTVFHGPRASLWGGLRQMAERLGRPDWGDRCALAMRVYYREPGWLWPLAPLALIHAQPA